jgi:hypothetical protein
MHRLAFLIVAAAIVVAACETANPMEPSRVTPSGASAHLRNDSTAPNPPGGATVNGRIMMGSGT